MRLSHLPPLAAAGLLLAAATARAEAPRPLDCPWIVKEERAAAPDDPAHAQSLFVRLAPAGPRYYVGYDLARPEIVYFYAVDAPRAGFEAPLTSVDTLSESLAAAARPLVVETPGRYHLRLEAPSGRAVVLIASNRPIEALERRGTRVFPDRPKDACRSRGGRDYDGPLPDLAPAPPVLACLPDIAAGTGSLCALELIRR